MDQTTVALLVRLTARVSVALFAAALIVFAAGYRHDRRRLSVGTRLFAGFLVAHTVHFATVAWLAVVTSGENIRERDGWAVVTTVALLFYTAAFFVLRTWGDVAAGSSSRSLSMANVAIVAIAAVFLISYLSRVAAMPIYWLPTVGLAGTVALHVARTRGATPPLRRRRSSDDEVDLTPQRKD